jgi:hypothetical protein
LIAAGNERLPVQENAQFFHGRINRENAMHLDTKPLPFFKTKSRPAGLLSKSENVSILSNQAPAIGGPSSPEASSFKAAGANNLVNLFTGDFSYSVPLLDVGGYPINLFYNGGITMEQEASWVGLGWNINPGSVSRNMRGVPDDFNGTDTLIQQQNVKPNKTWGGVAGIDGELLGIKKPKVNFNVGFSYNNYLGPEVDFGAGVSVSLPITKTIVNEKTAPADSVQGLSLSLGLNAKLSSRSGLTLSPSLNAGLHSITQKVDLGVGLSTSYNSRTGIKDLNLTSEMTLYKYSSKEKNHETSYSRNVINQGLTSSNISFARPSYIPTLRMPMQYANYSGQVELGAGMFGLRGAANLQGYYSESKIAEGSTTIYKQLVGFLYLEKARGNKNAVMDFNRLNDGEVTPNTKIISAPQYDYDIFSIQGEGTGGSIRAYRGDLGFMCDNETKSKDKNISIGFDIALPGHFGGNWNVVSSPTRSGGWDDANNTLNQTLLFNGPQISNSFENIYFRNPGESSVSNDNMINKLGRDNLVRFKIGGSAVSPRLESQLEMFSKKTGAGLGVQPLSTANITQQREKRTQVITMFSAADAKRIGLDTSIKNYLPGLDTGNNLQYNSIPRLGGYRKAHHISEINVLEQSGMRYVYGLPVYNTIQKDFTFSVTQSPDPVTNMVAYDSTDETTINSKSIKGNTGIDGYLNMQQTPAYASSFLITGLLSPDYVDVTSNGITEDDLGSAVKFNYTLSPMVSKWRTPRNNNSPATAHFNIGLKTEKRDNKATISYGEREAWYMHSIESKSMIAIFKTSSRNDAKGVKTAMNGDANTLENASLKLDSIMLYTKADIKANGFAGAIPLKTVHFEYTYGLCVNTPDNRTTDISGMGKLTLKNIYFTFNGQSRASKNRYVFDYGNLTSNFDNPNYATNSSDRWGTYKPAKDSANNAVNPNNMDNIDYPYTSTVKNIDDAYAGAWALKKILLPSGGQIEVQYEADDYAYVQNRRACNLQSIYGLGSSSNFIQNNLLYTSPNSVDQNYVYIKLPTPLQNTDPLKARQEIYARYLEGINQLAFKLNIYMPNGIEPITVYANYTDYGLCPNSTNKDIIYIQLTPIDGKGPLANASTQFLINNLPGQAFPNYDMSESTKIKDFLGLVISTLTSIMGAFQNPENEVRSTGMGSTVSLASSFIRLNAPTLFKYGGGHRVKRVQLKDNWNKMSGQYDSKNGQDYDYTTTSMVNGVPAIISSGVASYEPGIGSEENPFREILQFKNQLPMAPAIYGAIEMPVLEALFPSPVVGYSKVTVRSINRNGTRGDSVVRSSIGKQVTEFFTAKDYPIFATYTPMTNMDYHSSTPFSFFYKETIDKRTTSQGFLVETNDMHGKMRAQSSYSERDSKTPLSYTLYSYKNTGVRGLNDKIDFVQNDQGGKVVSGNMGVDMELMTDTREFSAITNGLNGQIQTDFFTFVPWPLFGLFAFPLKSYSENKYRAVTTTKLINYHAIEDSVIVNDKGSVISTKTIAYDAETGTPIVTQTANEFNDSIYNVTYPAYWAYSGVSPAYKNIGMRFSNVTLTKGKISGITDQSIFESGDELLVTSQGTAPADPCLAALAGGNVNKLWVFDINKNTTALTVPFVNKNLVIMDSLGNLFTKSNISFQIIRSGKRNNLGSTVSGATTMRNPIQIVNGARQLLLNDADSVIGASSVAYKEKWQVDKDVIPKTSFAIVNCVPVEVLDCNGTLQKHLNPYLKGLVGNYKPYRSYTYYGSRNETDPALKTNIRKNGYINSFTSFWSFDANSNLVPDTLNAKWVWNSELTKVNSHGQELETKDALNRYTAGQYGFEKNLPLAITQNARNGESFNESFEDYKYNEQMNIPNTGSCDSTRYISFNGLNGSIINTDTSINKAHSGKYDLLITGNGQLIKPLAVKPGIQDVFNFNWNADTTKALTTPGGNLGSTTITPQFAGTTNTPANNLAYLVGKATFSLGGYNSGTIATDNTRTVSGSNAYWRHNFTHQIFYYLQVTQNNTYVFTLQASNNGNDAVTQDISSINFSIKDLFGNIVGSKTVTAPSSSQTLSLTLCKGTYQITANIADDFTTYTNTVVTQISSTNQYSISISNNSALANFKNLSSVPSCTFTAPIPGTDSMLNPNFALVPGKKMQFSAWVREDCGNAQETPCYATTYKNNHITIAFPGSTDPNATIVLKPDGPIIEGWQKIERVFTVPLDATTSSLTLSNDSTRKIYFDDIRIHPFNANMKSYVYDPVTLRLSAELDENNYATFYDYDAEGQLTRVKKETIQGIKTIKETRSATQKIITTIQ